MGTMDVPGYRFGAPIGDAFLDWFHNQFVPQMKAKYGPDFEFATIIRRHDRSIDVAVANGEGEKFTGPEGLFANIEHKLAFVDRTGLNSSEARNRPDLVEPGDFPFEGAGTYRGYTGGVSGGKEESDWWIFCQVVDRWIELRASSAAPAIAACKDRQPGWKYLLGDPDTL
ncbi:MAG TPA: hypothetical protein VLF67_05135 [Candidatus Saccharimonas sp.]|nr:hypothetical protein [Candidatus Saccharimonas sp.]